MRKTLHILIIACALANCTTRLSLKFKTPTPVNNSPYLPPVYLEFRNNGRCIHTSQHPGSDSGPVNFQILGNYSLKNDTINVTYIWTRSIGSVLMPGETIEDRDWMDIEKYTQVFRLNKNRDTLWLLSDSSVKMSGYYILNTSE